MDTPCSRMSHTWLVLCVHFAYRSLVPDSAALCTWELENECSTWQPAVGCMEFLTPTSSGVISPLPHWGSTVTFCVHDIIGDAVWQMVCALEFAGPRKLEKSRRLARTDKCAI